MASSLSHLMSKKRSLKQLDLARFIFYLTTFPRLALTYYTQNTRPREDSYTQAIVFINVIE